jgi:hypothetical protein
MTEPSDPTPAASKGSRPGPYSSEFVTAALLAPPIAFLIVFVVVAAGALSGEGAPSPWVEVVAPFVFLLLAVFLWGAIPSVLFGAAVLTAIRWLRLPETYPVLVLGGGAAAALYIVAGLVLAVVDPSAAMFLAPWAALHQMEVVEGSRSGFRPDDLLIMAGILASGVAAGLIYARSVLRG